MLHIACPRAEIIEGARPLFSPSTALVSLVAAVEATALVSLVAAVAAVAAAAAAAAAAATALCFFYLVQTIVCRRQLDDGQGWSLARP